MDIIMKRSIMNNLNIFYVLITIFMILIPLEMQFSAGLTLVNFLVGFLTLSIINFADYRRSIQLISENNIQQPLSKLLYSHYFKSNWVIVYGIQFGIIATLASLITWFNFY